MNRLSLVQDVIVSNGDEEDFPDAPVRGNVPNRDFFEVAPFTEATRIREPAYNHLVMQPIVPPLPNRHERGYYYPLIGSVEVGDLPNQLEGRTVLLDEVRCVVNFRREAYERFDVWPRTVNLPLLDHSVWFFSCLVIDHGGYEAITTWYDRCKRIFTLQQHSYPQRNPDPAFLERYEVVSFSSSHLRASETWEHTPNTVMYESAEEPVPIVRHYIYDLARDIDEVHRHAVTDLNRLIELDPSLLAGHVYPDKDIFILAWVDDYQSPVIEFTGAVHALIRFELQQTK